MPETIEEQIISKLSQTADLYYRLIFVVAPSGSGKTAALRRVQEQLEVPLINVNLELSRRMLDLTARQRSLQVPILLEEIVNRANDDIALLDNIEILFDPALNQDPLKLLQKISRGKTLVVAWSGTCDGHHIIYASPEHREFRRYPIRDFVLICKCPPMGVHQDNGK